MRMTANGAPFDLLLRDARLSDGRVVTIGVDAGRYRAISDVADHTAGWQGRQTIAADGRLVTASFANAHMHLDKVYTLARAGDEALAAYISADMGGALSSIQIASRVKAGYDRSWLIPNVRRALDAAVRHGVLHVQAFVDVDTAAGLEGMHAVLAVREEYRNRLDLQVVAFPQDGVLRDPGAAQLCEEALRLGADVVGGIPWIEHTDRDAAAHIEWACRLARTAGARVAMLVDDAGDPSLRTTAMFAEALLEHDLAGRGVACHARALSQYPQPSVQRLIGLARQASLGFVSAPHTGPLHLPVRDFLAAGLPVALGQDDIEDAYYPFGRHNMIEVAFLAAHLLGYLSGRDQRTLLEMITTGAATVLGIGRHGITAGNPANLCVHGAERLVDLLREHAAPEWVVRDGRPLARTTTTSELLGPADG